MEASTRTRIALHTFTFCNTPARISTVEIFPGEYETMVMFDDGDEIEVFTTYTFEDARHTHNDAVNRWNDRIYDGSTQKLLGVKNHGQFVTTVVAC